MTWLRRNWAALLIIAAMVLAVGLVVRNSQRAANNAKHQVALIRNASLTACAAQDKAIVESNDRVVPLLLQRDTIYEFLRTAETARYANFKATGLVADLTAARKYGHQADMMQHVSFHSVPTIDCQRTYP